MDKKLIINNAIYPSLDRNAPVIIEAYNAVLCTQDLMDKSSIVLLF